VFNVSWAGEDESLNWFDTARELTERWHHQQQIRLATNRLGILTRELYYPVLDCFLRGLPHQFRDVGAPDGTTLAIEITGDCGGFWYLVKSSQRWQLAKSTPNDALSLIAIPQEIAWRVFTKGIDRSEARRLCHIEGAAALAEPVFSLTAIVG
jgi:hypothetical protein